MMVELDELPLLVLVNERICWLFTIQFYFYARKKIFDYDFWFKMDESDFSD